MIRQCLLFLCVFTCFNACKRSDNSFRDQYRWLGGNWHGKDGETTVIEQWKWNKYRFEGMGYRIFNGDTTTIEALFLERFGDVVGYTVVVNGKGPFSFRLINNEKGIYRFENADHDFPAIISYRLQNDSTISIDLMKIDSPHEPTISYQLKRGKQ